MHDNKATIPNLPMADYPLVNQYFGKSLRKLARALEAGELSKARFVFAAYRPADLEKRLKRLEPLGQTRAIADEVVNVKNPDELDRRLMDAWAELRVLDQLRREGFTEIEKVKEIADFTGRRGNHCYAVQVTRVNKSLSSQVEKWNTPGKRSSVPFGQLEDIYDRLEMAVYAVFRDRLSEKNDRFKDWSSDSWRHCIMVVSSEEELQDALIRHIVCRELRRMIHEWPHVYIDDLVWLPDNGNGAWFEVGKTLEETRCLVDWKDDLGELEHIFGEDSVRRREVDLDSRVDIN